MASNLLAQASRRPMALFSRLFFASLFDTRSHSNLAIQVPCIALQELILQQKPTVVTWSFTGRTNTDRKESDPMSTEVTSLRVRLKWLMVSSFFGWGDMSLIVCLEI